MYMLWFLYSLFFILYVAYACGFETRMRILLPCVAIYTLIRAYLDRSSSSEYFFVLLDKQYLELFMKTFCLKDE